MKNKLVYLIILIASFTIVGFLSIRPCYSDVCDTYIEELKTVVLPLNNKLHDEALAELERNIVKKINYCDRKMELREAAKIIKKVLDNCDINNRERLSEAYDDFKGYEEEAQKKCASKGSATKK